MTYYDEIEKVLQNHKASVAEKFAESDGGLTYQLYFADLELWITVNERNKQSLIVKVPVDFYATKASDGTGLVGPLSPEQKLGIAKWLDKYNNEFFGVKLYLDSRDDAGLMPVIYISMETLIFKKEQVGVVFKSGFPLLRDAANRIADEIHSNAKQL